MVARMKLLLHSLVVDIPSVQNTMRRLRNLLRFVFLKVNAPKHVVYAFKLLLVSFLFAAHMLR
jgi:hypothetical protein